MYQVGDLGGAPAPGNTLLPPAGYTTQPPTAEWAVAPRYTIPDYFCWQYCASGSTCPALTCGSGGACAATATSGEVIFGGSVPGVSVSPGDTISLVGCENTPSSPATEVVYHASTVTTVSFTTPAPATAPSVSPPTTPQTTASITNDDPRQSTICWTYSDPPVTPTCSAGICTSPSVTASDSSEGSVTLAGSGAPTGFVISGVAYAGGNTSLTIASTAGFEVGLPVIVAGNSNPLNNGVHTVSAVGATTLVFTGGGAGSGGTVGGYISAVFDFVAGGTSGLIEANGYTVSAIACNAVESSSPVASQTYQF